MAKNDLVSIVLKDIKQAEKQLAKEVAPEINKLFKESVGYALIDWYNSYDPKMYKRTNNFMTVAQTAKTIRSGNYLAMTVDSSLMNDYEGFAIKPYSTYEKQTLYADTAFDFFFNQGKHGHGRWMMKQSTPPFWYIDRDIQDGFGGRAQKEINKKFGELLRRYS